MRPRIREIVPAKVVDEDPTTLAMALEQPPELGPRSAEILDLIRRASLLTADERRRLGDAAAWRWWPLTLPVGGPSGGARATALLRARATGREKATRWLERVGALALGEADRRSLRIRAVANAGLALLVRDEIEDDAFEVLYGPWREVTHR